MTTTSRLLELLSLLQTRRDWPGPLLAERLGVSHRTIRRDVDRLREMGYAIETTMGPDGGYRLGHGSELPPLLFDDDQTIAVAVALQTASAAGIGIEDGAVRALATVRQVMPSRLRRRLDSLDVTAIGARPGSSTPATVSTDVIVSLADTIRAREVLRFDYQPRDAVPGEHPTPQRRVEPHHIATSHGRWYLLGWDLDREDWRLFSVDRVTPRVPTGPRFTPRTVPGGDVHEFVSARFKGQDVNRWPCRGRVVLHLPARDVLPFAGDGVVRALGVDRCSLEVGSWSWGALAASYGRFEATMEGVEPPELVAAFAVLAQRYMAAARQE
ncbi:WYL domain-containing protein [Phycicoccus sp. CSK15P-2]|uniref:helix-turn-helix transcriptional regulator n=1 Tax=Phycicoccus sp. CSK15P-2 TaxID=2807627 RepID=UPI001950C446|nr:WYL domain-containing protein [Phycicoccus sp. CSK15P-2]MBM6403977.1 WYL domain-containing protein [Phycicoccus sp. CSK15P-2]